MSIAMRTVLLATLVVVASCQGRDRELRGPLGIADVELTSTADRLDVRALGDDHAVVAELHLAQRVVKQPDDGREGEGRTLTIQAGGESAEHTSLGLGPLQLPISSHAPAFLAFVTDPRIAPALAARGIAFIAEDDAPVVAGEVAYTNCDSYPPTSMCSPTSCCQSGTPSYQKVCCGGNNMYAERRCTGAPSCAPGAGVYPACTTSGVTCPGGATISQTTNALGQPQWGCVNNCGPVGPIGCAVCMNYTLYASCATLDGGSYCDAHPNCSVDNGGVCGSDQDCCGYSMWGGWAYCDFDLGVPRCNGG
jgi:hypothetical protein